jgi:hypothetical protein
LQLLTLLFLQTTNRIGVFQLTVATGSVELANVDGSKIANRNRTPAVMLNDLVLGILSTASFNEDVAITKSGDSVCVDGQWIVSEAEDMMKTIPSQTSRKKALRTVQAPTQ